MIQRTSTRRTAWAATASALVLLLAGCGLHDDETFPLNSLAPKGKQADEIYSLVAPVFIVAGVVFVLVMGAALYLAIRYRRRKGDVDGVDEPIQRHGNTPLEWGWTILPALVLAILAIGNVKTIWTLENDQVDAPMEVDVIGQQWWWEYRYDLDDDQKPDIITANQLVIPAGTTVRLAIQSNDVIHSFWIPMLSGKKDAVPGRVHHWAITADQPGIYQGQCTEFCGLSHAYMRMEVKALSQEDYDTWVENQLAPVVEPTAGTEAADGKDIFFTKCASCHQIDGYDETGKELDSDAPDADYRGAQHPLISGNAPNLTHLMSRDMFAGNMFHLYEPGATREAAMPEGQPNEGQLGSWLRNPPGMKPMNPDANRGMPNLQLPEDEIRKLVAYLTLLK
jgi:cytochrome c oxidase subunit 2